MNVVQREKYRGCTIKIATDEEAESPRTAFDGMGKITMWRWPRDLVDPSDKDAVRLPERHWARPERKHSMGDIYERYLRCYHDVVLALPLRYEDWGSRGSKFETWDGMADVDGFIYLTRAALIYEYGNGPEALAKAKRYLTGEVEELNAWHNGEVYGYTVKIVKPHGEGYLISRDSCWGYYGVEDALAEAKGAVDGALGPAAVATTAS